mgnify:CR=1 FL=1
MSASDRYNGWTNYETWAVALWLDNDQGSQEYWREIAEEAWRTAKPGEYTWQTQQFEAVSALAEYLEDAHIEHAGERLQGVNDVFSDLLSAALSSVDWREIAKHYIDDVADEIDVEEVKERAEEEAVIAATGTEEQRGQ